MQVVWTKQAEDSFNETIDYLLLKWTAKEANNFIDLVESIIEKIERNPKLFKRSVFDKQSREVIITKHTSMFYRELNEEVIEIEFFWNNYRDPKIKKEIIK
ncbi:type II toxin-antitoxin system RelE/ParE family toxin [Algibacter amylolyticus]|uniref:Type II toxin-antitoxin system RelE/ParE family toxin n=1 Tax=Algibacter amylolyticus TaxID=1608400 RepID=A0A5M7BD14_9FLAO|nr:type II toxin-antitoxin system RelE/ParE family toxin [Algibacter amylolyticus]KAA5827543.1 type II toxin-antitoxin system RelE/ParE family toxin [Algibacter amylolyticus]MBB5266749.1 plasmid stabilization system protein ParE [Algibacter amylolyticus]TSJ81788.1 type II toxin-antitoxin system RelE/ParE family toxin [Algibacter amylolyticus]